MHLYIIITSRKFRSSSMVSQPKTNDTNKKWNGQILVVVFIFLYYGRGEGRGRGRSACQGLKSLKVKVVPSKKKQRQPRSSHVTKRARRGQLKPPPRFLEAAGNPSFLGGRGRSRPRQSAHKRAQANPTPPKANGQGQPCASAWAQPKKKHLN